MRIKKCKELRIDLLVVCIYLNPQAGEEEINERTKETAFNCINNFLETYRDGIFVLGGDFNLEFE